MIGQQYLKKKKPTYEKDWCRHGIEIYSQSRHSDQMDEYLKKKLLCYPFHYKKFIRLCD